MYKPNLDYIPLLLDPSFSTVQSSGNPTQLSTFSNWNVRRATKYILNDYSTDYKSRLIKLHMLPLMYILDVKDVMFFLKNLHHLHNGFDINNFIKFATGHTLETSCSKQHHLTIPLVTSILTGCRASGMPFLPGQPTQDKGKTFRLSVESFHCQFHLQQHLLFFISMSMLKVFKDPSPT